MSYEFKKSMSLESLKAHVHFALKIYPLGEPPTKKILTEYCNQIFQGVTFNESDVEKGINGLRNDNLVEFLGVGEKQREEWTYKLK